METMTTTDVFISYAHVDNEALLDEQDGWVAILQRVLQTRLTQLLGRVAVVWWDKRRIDENHYFDEVIEEACQNSTVMLSIVTPRYLNSDYCRKEVDYFAHTHELRVGHRSRLLTCIKTPVERAHLFPEMAGMLGYEFFHFIEESGHFREYDVYDPELKSRFMTAVEDLAQDLKQLLLALAPSPRTGGGANSSIQLKGSLGDDNPRVFVASACGEVKAVRETIVRELSSRGHSVVPSTLWSEDGLTFEQELLAAASDAALSVHIFGAAYGTTPEGASAAYPVLQFERLKQLASARPPERPLARIVWVPREVAGTGEQQRAFLHGVRNDPNLGPLDELLEGSEEELKERVVAKLARLVAVRRGAEPEARPSSPPVSRFPTWAPGANPGTIKKVYVISAHTEEKDQVRGVERVLGDRGIEVLSSAELSEEDSEAAREARHQQLLEACHGCLILHGKTKVSWVRAQVDDVRKALARRRQGPMRGHAVYVVPPLDELKLRYQVQFPKLPGSLDPAHDLEPFVQELTEGEPELGVAQHATR
jgi:hypothetical protein